MTDLERALVALGRDLDVPGFQDVAPTILARLERPRRYVPRRKWALAVALILLAALAATLAVPDARSALFRVLHIGGERIEIVDELPGIAPEPIGLGLDLGETVTLEAARTRAGFDLRELDDAPDRVYLGPRGTVWFLYGTPTSARLLVGQTALLSLDENFVSKKLAGPGTRVEILSVEGEPGVFLSGEPHFVILLDELGNPVEESAWLARNVLVWEDDGIALRLEGDFPRARALELAASLR
ncbi:hypothetical protein BH09ACT13_BH09ACT13_09150 [soil metagenome]